MMVIDIIIIIIIIMNVIISIIIIISMIIIIISICIIINVMQSLIDGVMHGSCTVCITASTTYKSYAQKQTCLFGWMVCISLDACSSVVCVKFIVEL